MMDETQLLAVAALALFAGSTLLLSRIRWFRRRPLGERLAPYVPGGSAARSGGILMSADTFAQVVGPLARAVGERLARAVGVTEALAVRLERVGSTMDVTAFRVRQLGWAGVGLVIGTVLAAATQQSGPVALLLIVTGPLIGFLVVEQRLAVESRAWQRRIFLELPVVAEQLGMLLAAGYSLGAGLTRLAARGKGACGRDLRRVVGRIRQGLSEAEALHEWAAVADVDALHRLVGVLALNRQSGDLGRLIGDEARAIRRDVHRELIETIERRGQQVWIPVTVAALVPGVIFLAVPFIDALRLFANS
ncbi:MAG TPA: type II secretion system F family protein [Acidimicrobiales bacterium]|nr:type II secretion system F family protein [Acidimicrobiales bacterium]